MLIRRCRAHGHMVSPVHTCDYEGGWGYMGLGFIVCIVLLGIWSLIEGCAKVLD